MDVNSWLGVALPGIPIINHFLQLYKSICAFCRHTDNKRPPSSLISIKTTIIFGISGNLLFHDFRSYVVKFMVPIFLVHIWNDLPPPLKSQEEGTRNAFWVMRPPFCTFWTEMTCHRNMIGCATGSPTTTNSRITCYILFCLTFMQLSFTTTKSYRTPIIHDYYLA